MKGSLEVRRPDPCTNCALFTPLSWCFGAKGAIDRSSFNWQLPTTADSLRHFTTTIPARISSAQEEVLIVVDNCLCKSSSRLLPVVFLLLQHTTSVNSILLHSVPCSPISPHHYPAQSDHYRRPFSSTSNRTRTFSARCTHFGTFNRHEINSVSRILRLKLLHSIFPSSSLSPRTSYRLFVICSIVVYTQLVAITAITNLRLVICPLYYYCTTTHIMASDLWVFGYGSLIWNPGFEHSKALIGQIKGYSRKFYQGSDVHRGRPDKLGRVVTLIEEKEGSTWGTAFLPKDEQVALSYLGQRESSLGGYDTALTYFYPRDPKEKPFLILVYIALPNNSLFLGADPVPKIAHDIATSEGECGHNVEYLSKLVAFMRIELPHITDEHLFEIEKEVRNILENGNSSVLKLFTDAIDAWLNRPTSTSLEMVDELLLEKEADKQPETPALSPFKFVDSVPKRKLRCIHKF